MNIEVLKGAHNLMHVWNQYSLKGAWYSDINEDGTPNLYHACMSAGGDACEWLESIGLACDDGGYCVLTQKGKDVYHAETHEDFKTIAFKNYNQDTNK